MRLGALVAVLTNTLSASSAPVSAASPAVTFELVDAEPVSVRVSVLKLSTPFAKGSSPPCAFATPIFEGLLEKAKPLTVATDAYRLCIAQTRAPFTKVDFGPPIYVAHVAGMAPLRMLVRSRANADGVPPTPRMWMAPLTLAVLGNDAIGVRVAAGTTGPCNASGNTPLFSGVLAPGVPRTLVTDASCVCIEQTFAPFLSAGWTPATIQCRPTYCLGKNCAMSIDTFELALPSAAP